LQKWCGLSATRCVHEHQDSGTNKYVALHRYPHQVLAHISSWCYLCSAVWLCRRWTAGMQDTWFEYVEFMSHDMTTKNTANS
jgi:hypothetical protein